MNAAATLTLRPAEPADAARLQTIYLAAYAQAFPWRALPHSLIEDSRGERQMLIQEDDAIQGFVSFHAQSSFIHHLYVHPSAQHRGLGRALLQAAVQAMPHPVRLKCVRRNQPAMRFYERSGWRPASPQPADAGEWLLLEYSNAGASV